jgi:hypothetical protein
LSPYHLSIIIIIVVEKPLYVEVTQCHFDKLFYFMVTGLKILSPLGLLIINLIKEF